MEACKSKDSPQPYSVDPVETVDEAIKRINANPALQELFAAALPNNSKPYDEDAVTACFLANLESNIDAYCKQF